MEPIRFLGLPLEHFDENRLPTITEVLKVYFFGTRNKKLSKQASANDVANKLIDVWSHTTRIIQQKSDIVKKVLVLVDKYDRIMKNCQRNNAKQRDNENNFIGLLNGLFDITNNARTRESQQGIRVNYENIGDDDYIPRDGNRKTNSFCIYVKCFHLV